MDARARRSRTKLATAVLELAERDGIENVSMVAIAQAAGVNRSTVYEHASSPIDLLRTVLREELDAIRSERLDVEAGGDVRDAVFKTTLDVLRHVDSHAAIYRRGLGGAGSADLHGMLSIHFRRSVLTLLESGSVTPPPTPGLDPALRDDAVARFIADGTVGAIDAWLTTDPPRDVDGFFALFRTLVPAWWPLT
jgi:AcrR family transcriptional regulator